MHNLKKTFAVVSFLACTIVSGQSATNKDTTYVNKLIDDAKKVIIEDPSKTVDLSKEAAALASQLNFKTGEASALKFIGNGYYFQKMHVEALDYWNQSLKAFEQLNDKVGVANLLNNIAAVYNEYGDDAKALEYSLRSLKLAEQTGDKIRIYSSLTTIGAIYHNKKDKRAIDYMLKALKICEEMGNDEELAVLHGNIGEIYLDHQQQDKALPFYQQSLKLNNSGGSAAFAYNGLGKIYLNQDRFQQALQHHYRALNIAEKVDDKSHQLSALKGIANVHFQQNDLKTALAFYNKAKVLGEAANLNVELKDLYKEMAVAYEKSADFPNAYLHNTLYANIKDTLYSTETAKKLGSLQFEFDLYKKEGEITLLTQEKKLQEAEVKRQKQAKTAFAIGLVLILIIAFEIFRNYKNKVRTNKILDKQKDEIEHLLLNILPVEVANELKAEGKSTPRSYERVSVLFTDFKGFTTIADKMSPEVLVEQLNECFMAFDSIIEKNKLEKIKTIGDSYMCAGGIPTVDIDHPFRVINASLEIQEYMKATNKKRVAAGLEPWDIRIGVHVGPVVAGVVGKKKYAYDIWGSTVNIASRMESNGEPGQVNISARTYEFIKEKYICRYRGKIHAKNVGDIDMYFVESEIKLPKPARATETIEELVKSTIAN